MNNLKDLFCYICKKRSERKNLVALYCTNCKMGELIHKECSDDNLLCDLCGQGILKEQDE